MSSDVIAAITAIGSVIVSLAAATYSYLRLKGRDESSAKRDERLDLLAERQAATEGQGRLIAALQSQQSLLDARLESSEKEQRRLWTENSRLKSEVYSLKDEVLSWKLRHAEQAREIEELRGENVILRTALQHNGIEVPQLRPALIPPTGKP